MKGTTFAAALLLSLASTPVAAGPPDPWIDQDPRQAQWTPADVLLAAQIHGPWVECIFQTEVGGVGYDPYAVGSGGEVGPAQLKPDGGLLQDFLEWSTSEGFRPDPNNPYTAALYLKHKREEGKQWNWAGVRLGICPP